MIPVDMVVGVPMAVALGFAYGMGPCLISCAPFLGPVFLASEGGVCQSWRIVLPLSLGRIGAYTGFGALVGSFSYYVKGMVLVPALHLVLGAAVLAMGLALLLRKPATTCAAAATGSQPLRRMDRHGSAQRLLPGGLFLMGVAMTLSPCAPLGIVLFSAAMSGSGWSGAELGLGFGLGAALVPALFYGWGVAYVGARLRDQLREWQPRLERVSAGLLVVVGVSNLVRW